MPCQLSLGIDFEVKRLFDRAEFVIVITVAFGYFILGSVVWALYSNHRAVMLTDSQLWFLVVYESVVLVFLAAFLAKRGWRAQSIGLVFHRNDPVTGVGLFITAYAAYFLLYNLLLPVLPDLGRMAPKGSELEWIPVLLVSIINPVFEEVFVCGYVISYFKLSGQSLTFAVNVSIAIRLAYHLYQGVNGVILIIPLGLLFTYWVARSGRLWPVIIAHALIDFTGLIVYV